MSANVERSPKQAMSKTPIEGNAKSVTVQASPNKLLQAVSTPEELRGWWSRTMSAGGEAGEELKFEFAGGAHHARIRLESAREPSLAKWHVIEHRPLKEWDGTALIFSISPVESGKSRLEFLPSGLGDPCEYYGLCLGGWDRYMRSLRQYVESGKGPRPSEAA
jgi:hypothetical protein